MDNNDLRRKALLEIEQVEWIPTWGRDRIYNMVEARPDWCHRSAAQLGRSDNHRLLRKMR